MSGVLYFFNNTKTSMALSQKCWEKHPLGSPELWPQELKTVLAITLESKQPMVVFWSDHAYCFYNDPYLDSIEKKIDINLIGEEAKFAWKKIWPTINKKVKQVCS